MGIAHVGVDGRWLRVNDRLCAIVGYPREELLRRTFQDITHPDDLADGPGARAPGPRGRDPDLLDGEALPPQGPFPGLGQPDRLARAERGWRAPALHLRGGGHHRADARRGGARGPARRAWRRVPTSPASRSTRSTSSTAAMLRRRPLPRPLRHSPGPGDRASRPWSSGWSTSIPTTAQRVLDLRRATARREAGAALRRSIASCIRPGARGGSITWPASPRRDADRTHGQAVRCPARHHGGQAGRGGAARPEPAPDPGPRGGARAARARAARRRDAAARRAGDRRRPRRARRAGRRRRPR